MSDDVLEEVPVKLSPSAVNKLKQIRASALSDGEVAQYLRVGVKGGGCSGLSYLLAFDEKTDKDRSYNLEGFDVVIERSHIMYVLGMEIDYTDGLNSRGFEFSNPNAKDTCGCGTSFNT